MNANELIVLYIGGKYDSTVKYDDNEIIYYRIPACGIPISSNAKNVFKYSETDLYSFQNNWNWIIPIAKKILNDSNISSTEKDIIKNNLINCDIKLLYKNIIILLNV